MPQGSASTHSSQFSIPADHPSLPGHFPGNPIVPGVIILEHVIRAAEAWLGRDLEIRHLPHAKFLAPLRPEQTAWVDLSLQHESLKFTVRMAQDWVAKGSVQLAPKT